MKTIVIIFDGVREVSSPLLQTDFGPCAIEHIIKEVVSIYKRNVPTLFYLVAAGVRKGCLSFYNHDIAATDFEPISDWDGEQLIQSIQSVIQDAKDDFQLSIMDSVILTYEINSGKIKTYKPAFWEMNK